MGRKSLMPGFCAVADIAAFLQLTIAADNASALRAIDEATGAIQNYCEQAIEEVDDDETTFDVGERQGKLFLPESPVTEVSEVVENGVTLTVDVDYKLGNHGILYRVGTYWYPGIQTVTVTYTHGYATIPQTVVDVCTRMAARAFQAGLRAKELAGVAGVSAKTLGDYSVTFGSEIGGGSSEGGTLGASAAPILLPSERHYVNAYKRERI
jgi:hypothetical protein